MRNWVKRLLGHEGEENSVQTQEALDKVEQRTLQYEKRVEHLRRERLMHENHRGRETTQ